MTMKQQYITNLYWSHRAGLVEKGYVMERYESLGLRGLVCATAGSRQQPAAGKVH